MDMSSLLQYVFDPWEHRCGRRNDWSTFGMGITPNVIDNMLSYPSWSDLANEKSLTTPVTVRNNGFQACVDVQQFRPKEIIVKTVNNSVTVEAKHEERLDEQGYISRQFVRRYILPDGYDPKEVIPTLSSDGILIVKVPPPSNQKSAIGGNEPAAQIQQTGPAYLDIKVNSADEESEAKDNPSKVESK